MTKLSEILYAKFINMKLPNRTEKGFTLIELLVVISIIAILAVIGVAVYSGQQKNARDARRRADIEAISGAMEASKVAGQLNYTALAATMFVSGSIPADPTNSNVVPADNACPGVCKYCVKSSIGTCAETDTAVGVGAPAAVPTWTLCANLESGGSFCRSNAQ